MSAPPKLWRRFFRWFCHPDLLPGVEGDLMELYNERLAEQGKRKANRRFIIDVLLLFRPGIIRPAEGAYHLNIYGMFKNYLKVAFRGFARNKFYTAISIGGFMVGVTSSLLIILHVFQELSYDRHHEKFNRIYRVTTEYNEPDSEYKWALTQLPLGKAAKEEISEVEQYVRFNWDRFLKFQKDNSTYFEKDIFWVDSTVFDIFTFKVLAGNAATALNNPNSIVISKSMAERLFGSENPVGEILETDVASFKVTAVFKDFPKTSHIIPNAMISASSSNRYNAQDWGWFTSYTYILLKEGADPDRVQKGLDNITERHVAGIFDQYKVKVRYRMMPIDDIHLHSTFESETGVVGNVNHVYIFSVIAIFLIAMASINYMNLATARSMRRAREVGIRKVLGANRAVLIGQFVSESTIITALAFLLGISSLAIVIPLVNTWIGTDFEFESILNRDLLLMILMIICITGLASGSYPAFYLSSFKPVDGLRSINSEKSGSRFTRRLLVGFQFSISIFMLIGTIVIYDQMSYLQNKDLGFDKDQVAVIQYKTQQDVEKLPVLKALLEENPRIAKIGTATSYPGQGFNTRVIKVENSEGRMEEYGINTYAIDYDFFPALGIELLEGRNISPEFLSDLSRSVIVNQAMVKRMGWKNAVGKRFQFPWDSLVRYKVAGVVKDFHQQSLYSPIEPLMFYPRVNNSKVLIKIEGDVKETLTTIEQNWSKVYPDIPFEYSFLDESFMKQHESDIRQGQLFFGFSTMMILISSLGLLGLIAFVAEQRSKEISIRKVMGARHLDTLILLNREFIIVLIGAISVASPFAWLFMEQWLSSFAFRVGLDLWIPVLVGLSITILTVLIISSVGLKVSVENPIKYLRSE